MGTVGLYNPQTKRLCNLRVEGLIYQFLPYCADALHEKTASLTRHLPRTTKALQGTAALQRPASPLVTADQDHGSSFFAPFPRRPLSGRCPFFVPQPPHRPPKTPDPRLVAGTPAAPEDEQLVSQTTTRRVVSSRHVFTPKPQ